MMGKLIGFGTAVALLLFAQPAAAGSLVVHGCGCGEWTGGAHALYFLPITCPFTYASVGDQTVGEVDIATFRALAVPCRSDWGFRLFGNYLLDCIFAGVSYQHVQVTTTRSSASVGLSGGGIGGAGPTVAQRNIEYQNLNARVGTYLTRGCNSALYLYGNVRWIDLSHRRAVSYVRARDGSSEYLSEKSKLEGGAIGIGVGGECDVWCGLGVFIDGNVLGVIGSRSLTDVKYRQAGVEFRDQRLSYPSDLCVIPEANFRVGLNYTYACACWTLVGELGYEVDYFWDGSVFPNFNGVELVANSLSAAPACEDIGFSGLFFGARIIF
jgi:Legionella pneumophila major outer membrane protein precursor